MDQQTRLTSESNFADEPVAKAEQSMPYEEAIQELEKIVRQLESGQLTLDQSLKAFQRGTELASLCKARLSEVEQSIQKVVSQLGEDLKTEALGEMPEA